MTTKKEIRVTFCIPTSVYAFAFLLKAERGINRDEALSIILAEGLEKGNYDDLVKFEQDETARKNQKVKIPSELYEKAKKLSRRTNTKREFDKPTMLKTYEYLLTIGIK